MAEHLKAAPPEEQPWRMSIEQARKHARERFLGRLAQGEQVGNCSCSDDVPEESGDESVQVIGVRFRDSARLYFFITTVPDLAVGSWVVVATTRGEEAARVVIAPHQMTAAQLQGSSAPIVRILSEGDVERIDGFREQSARAVRRGGELSRANNWGIKVVAADFSIDGSRLTLSYSSPDDRHTHRLRDELAREFELDVEMRRVGPRDETRLIGGLGKCGRALCCASWLPVYPDITTGMARNQDLSLNPASISGLCGRLLCCLSYENEQYRQAKRLLPRLGQTVLTDYGLATVVSLQILKELVTIRYDESGQQETLPAAEVLGNRPSSPPAESSANVTGTEQVEQSRRRRGRRRLHTNETSSQD